MNAKVLRGREIKLEVDKKGLGHFLFEAAERYKERICQIDGVLDIKETFASVKQRSTRVAITLQKMGIKSNDVIAFCCYNTIDNTIPMLGTFYLGAKPIHLDPTLSPKHTKYLLNMVTPRVIFVEETTLKLIEDGLKNANFTPEIVVMGETSKYLSFHDFVKPQKNETNFKPTNVDVHDTAVMFFNSEPTGTFKTICHSHYTFFNIINQTQQSGLQGNVFHFSTFYWISATIMLISSFRDGSYRVFCHKIKAEDALKIIEKYKVQCVFIAPVLTYMLTNFHFSKIYDTSSLKLIMCGGSPVPLAQEQKMRKLFPKSNIFLIYAMTETGVISMFDLNTDKDLAKRKEGSYGKVAPGSFVKIVDTNTRKILGPNKSGEICVKSPSLMVGYYNADCSEIFDDDGFLKTGDLGYYDEDNCIYLKERLRDILTYQSWHIIPSSIETVLIGHPAVKEAAVFGIPSDEHGEVPAACIILNDNFRVSKEDIDKFLIKRVADWERLRGGIFFIPTLPKTPTGNVIRGEIRNAIIKTLHSSTI